MSDLSKITPEQWAAECRRRRELEAQSKRYAVNARRIKWALRNCRLWMWHRNTWIDMTDQPLNWYANKASRAVKVARVKCGVAHHYRRP